MRRASFPTTTAAALVWATATGVAAAPTAPGPGAGGATDTRPVAALRAGDLEALRALARGLPTADLLAALSGDDVTAVHAAIAMADSTPEAWRALGRLADLARGWNRGLAAAAAEAGRRIALALTPDAVERADLADDELARPQQRWAEVVAAGDRWPDVRAAGLTIVAALADARAAPARRGSGAGPGRAALARRSGAGGAARGDRAGRATRSRHRRSCRWRARCSRTTPGRWRLPPGKRCAPSWPASTPRLTPTRSARCSRGWARPGWRGCAT